MFMKKMVFFFALNLTACKNYTIKNDYIEDVRAGYVIIKSGQCLPFFDLPFLGDFPMKFRYKDHQLMSKELYKPGHYKISKQADILKQREPCELDPVKKKTGKEASAFEAEQAENKEDTAQTKEGDFSSEDDKSATPMFDNSLKKQNESSSQNPDPKDQDKTSKQSTHEFRLIAI